MLILATHPSLHGQQQYMNETFRFTLNCPSGWTVLEFDLRRTKDTVFLHLKESSSLVPNISVFADNRYASPEDAFNDLKPHWKSLYSGFRIISERRIMISNIESSEVVWTSAEYTDRWIYVPRGKSDLLEITYSSAPSTYDTYLSLADRCIDSFRLVEKVTFSVAPKVASMIIDGTTYRPNDLPRSMWLEYGRAYSLSVESLVPASEGTRYALDMWSDGSKDSSRRITVTRSGELTAQYKTQYELKVQSELGNPQGAGWYDEGTTAQISVSSPIPESGIIGILGAKTIFDHWSGDSVSSNPSELVVMNRQKAVVAVWKKDYAQAYLTVAVVVAAITMAVVVAIRKRSGLIRPSSLRPPVGECAPEKKCAACGATTAFDSEYCDECGAKQTTDVKQ
jgi:hypothetical protein